MNNLNLFQILTIDLSYEDFWTCLNEPTEETIETVREITWTYLILRHLELLETIFIVLRKKQRQITFLHIYQPLSDILIFWSFLNFSDGVMEIFIIAVSEIAHVVKYFYYLLSAYTNVTKIYVFLKFIKPLLISLHVLQLLFICVQSIIAVQDDCSLSSVFYVEIVNSFGLIVMNAKLLLKYFNSGNKTKY